MTALLAAIVITFGTLGLCAIVTTIGAWATVRPRLEHKREMFVLHEKAKLTAIEINERQLTALGRATDPRTFGESTS